MRPSLATKRRLLQSSAETDARVRSQAVAPPAQLQQHARLILSPPPLPPQPPQQQPQQRRGGCFQKCQELSDAVLNGDHDRAMELAYCYRGKKHEFEKLEQAQDHGYYSKK